MDNWTAEQVKEHVEAILRERDRLFDQHFREIDSMIKQVQREGDKFEDTVIARFKLMNEFRGALDDLGKQMATRRELEDALKSMLVRHEDNRNELNELRSRIDTGPAQLFQLQSRIDATSGLREGVHTTVAMVVSIVGALTAVIAVILVLVH